MGNLGNLGNLGNMGNMCKWDKVRDWSEELGQEV